MAEGNGVSPRDSKEKPMWLEQGEQEGLWCGMGLERQGQPSLGSLPYPEGVGTLLEGIQQGGSGWWEGRYGWIDCGVGLRESRVDECRLCVMRTCWPRAVVKEGSRSL